MKLIDILVMISKGELKEGTQVKWGKFVHTCDYYFWANEVDFFEDLNEEVELIEPECEHEWAKYSLGRLGGWTEFRRRCKKCGVDEEEPTDNTAEKIKELDISEMEIENFQDVEFIFTDIACKLNEVIRYINKEE